VGAALHLAAALGADVELIVGLALPAIAGQRGSTVVDAHRPELWDAPYVEAAAFHESFGDMSAILAALQLPTVRAVPLPGIANNPGDMVFMFGAHEIGDLPHSIHYAR